MSGAVVGVRARDGGHHGHPSRRTARARVLIPRAAPHRRGLHAEDRRA
ncbi:hypothetical protein ACFSM7_01090 [Clavibacter michiganensis subsp. tessellarius]